MSSDQSLQDIQHLFMAHYTALCHRAFQLVNDEDAAKDVVQEVFIRLWKQMENGFMALENPEAYLHRAVRNQALNYLDREKRQLSFATELQATSAISSNDTEDNLGLEELQQKVQTAIESLPLGCRKVFLLSRYGGLSHKEIAEQLQISPNTVDNHIKKALSILRKYLVSGLLIIFKIFLGEA
ncbi:RNA polymerase sigma-70 factor [Sabulibacter ruber]|uniref:RNA polymerase sigma-70 factor n=1 Tax=Sabulibacter ruber TaxID=2811901 RepID=UPI001A961D3A|nr:RNA polymerase sigma-70 factor [Sabulibacter ruber]